MSQHPITKLKSFRLMNNPTVKKILQGLVLVFTIYLFLLSIKLLGHSFKSFGVDFARMLIEMTTNPFAGLIIGIVATSLIQSSSTTTSIVVGLVAGDALTFSNAIPIIMGANIGTTITNTLVSMGHMFNRNEFRRAFSASIVHDFFNICVVIVLFPIEIKTKVISKSALMLEKWFEGAGGLKLFNPISYITKPVIKLIGDIVEPLPMSHIVLTVISLFLLFFALSQLVKIMRSVMLKRIEVIVNEYLFKNALFGLLFGLLVTAVVQSSSVTTSLIIPLAGAGLVTVRQIFPYTLGANLGTTITALLAAMATQNSMAVAVAFSHLFFNIYGIMIFYPLRSIPIRLAEWVGKVAAKSKKNLVLFFTIYILLHFIPVVFILFT